MSAGTISIRSLEAGEAATCEHLMRALPQWFGIEEAIVEYRDSLEELETIVATRQGEVIGFLTLRRHNPRSAEIHVMAVRETSHRRGVGRALVTHAENLVRERGVEYLQVKTLGPSRESDEYSRTRSFYEAMGFVPLEENALWGDVNPCLIMVKHVQCSRKT